jgi:hypothetical protein
MIIEVMEGSIYKSFDGDRLLLTITSLGNNTYRAVNMDCDITAEVEPVDDYITRLTCIEHKRRGKDGRYRKTTKLLQSNLFWLDYMLQEKGFIRKAKAR